MSVKFKVVNKKLPTVPGKDLYFALAVPQNYIGLKALSESISNGSTFRKADVYGVLLSLVEVMEQEFKNGNAVVMGDLGRFSVSVKSSPCTDASQVTAQKIINQKIDYRPSKHLKSVLETLTYKKDKS